MPLTLTWKCTERLATDGSTISPDSLAGLTPAEVVERVIPFGNSHAKVGDLFLVDGSRDDGELRVEGDLVHVHGLAAGMRSGRLVVRGSVGDRFASGMIGGSAEVFGSVGQWAAAEMKGGRLRIRGDAGDYLGAALPGSRVGMREGVILVDGSVGREAAASMRRGLIAIGGDCGEALGMGLVAGSIFVRGRVGPLVGLGMKRGSIVCLTPGTRVPASFEPSGDFRPKTLNVYFKQLVDWGFELPSAVSSMVFDRYNGDLSGRGQGEILAARA